MKLVPFSPSRITRIIFMKSCVRIIIFLGSIHFSSCDGPDVGSSEVSNVVCNGREIVKKINAYKISHLTLPASLADLPPVSPSKKWVYIPLDKESFMLIYKTGYGKDRIEYRFGDSHFGLGGTGWFYLKGHNDTKLE